MTGILTKRLIGPHERRKAAEATDEDLLNQYLAAMGPEAEDAFRELVERHGPMVLGVCRHVLNQAQDAEDAFQATFLMLARRGATIRDRRVLSGWLHEVAYRIALRLRTGAVRRRALERQGMAMRLVESDPDDQGERAAWEELRPVLHEEVNRLPAKYRIPVILSYLQGKTNEEVAELLRWPIGTVKGRLSRARDLLRSRLARRGLALAAAFLMTSLSRGRVFAEVVPAGLARRTARVAFPPLPPQTPTDPPPSPEDPGSEPPPVDELTDLLVPDPARFPRIALIVSLLLLSFSVVLASSLGLMGPWWGPSRSGGAGFSLDLRSYHPAPATSSHCP